MSESEGRPTTVRIRRAPKISVFLALGGAIGVIVSLILTASFPIDETVGFAATFGYFAIYGVVIGVLVGAVIAVILDRASSRRAKEVTASVDRLSVPDDYADDEEPEQ